MKKLLPVLIIMLLLTACNFPGEEDYSQDPVVQTRVSLILTQGAQTQVAKELDETQVVLPDQTQTPTDGLQEVFTPTAGGAESTTATLQPEPGPTDTPVPTQVLSTDPWGGQATFVEDFAVGDYWHFESAQLYSMANDGQLEFTSKGTPWWSSYYTTKPEVKNGYFETTFSMPNCKGLDRFGLVMRWSRGSDFYYMGVTCDGKWGFTQYTLGNETIDILPYQASDALNPTGETNQNGIFANEDAFEFYVNRQKVGSATHSAVTGPGNFGFLTMSSGTKNFRTLIDRLEYWTE